MEEFKNAFEGFVTTLEKSPNGKLWLGVILAIQLLFIFLIVASFRWKRSSRVLLFSVIILLEALGLLVLISVF